jgi:hypothetical protein
MDAMGAKLELMSFATASSSCNANPRANAQTTIKGIRKRSVRVYRSV